MLHALPDLLDALESRLVAGEDPMNLLASIRWSELVGWPKDREDARAIQGKVARIQALVNGLQSPLRATLMGLAQTSAYSRDGYPVGAPAVRSCFHDRV